MLAVLEFSIKEALKGSLPLSEAAQYPSFLPKPSQTKATFNQKPVFPYAIRAVRRTGIRNMDHGSGRQKIFHYEMLEENRD